jgi:hypothetical protein
MKIFEKLLFSVVAGAANNDGIICAGSSAILTASSGAAYVWSTGATTGSISVTTAGTYSVTVSDANGCQAATSATITVNPQPTVSITVTDNSGVANNDGIACQGANVTLTAVGSGPFVWTPGGATTASINVNTSGTYTVTTSINGCTTTSSRVVTINPNPTVTITGTTTACVGTSITLTANGADTYLWGTGETTPSITFQMPGAPSIITVTGTNTATGCSATAQQGLTPLLLPVVLNAALTQPTTCAAANGAIALTVQAFPTATYNWATNGGSGLVQGNQNQTSLTVGTYTVTITSGQGCTSSATYNLIGPGGCDICPTIASVTVGTPRCSNAPISFTASGLQAMGNTYGIRFVAFPAAVGDPYTAAGGTTLATVPNGSLTNAGTTATTTASAPAGNHVIYALLSPTPPDPACRPSANTAITVNPPATAGIAVADNSGTTPNDGILCVGASATLTATGGTSYSWSTGATTAAITVSAAGTYSVTVVNDMGCSGTASTAIIVNALPTPAITVTDNSGTTPNDGVVCQGASATLTASGGTSYIWSTGATTAAITVNTANNYTVTVTNANGCTATATSAITVNPLPTPAISFAETSGVANNDGIICSGASATLTASGGTSYVWSNGFTTTSISVSVAGTYTVTATNANGCQNTATATITVNPLPTAFAVTGGGTRCSTDGGLPIGLAGSQTGVNYQLQLDGTNVGRLTYNMGHGNSRDAC